MSLIKQQLYNTMNAREQLMNDIECIIESKYGHTADGAEDLIVSLCDAVIRNFPTTMYSISELEETAIDPMGTGK
jgi:hypothetical protein